MSTCTHGECGCQSINAEAETVSSKNGRELVLVNLVVIDAMKLNLRQCPDNTIADSNIRRYLRARNIVVGQLMLWSDCFLELESVGIIVLCTLSNCAMRKSCENLAE